MPTISMRHTLVRIVLIAAVTISTGRHGSSPEATAFVGNPTRIAMRVAFDDRVSDRRLFEHANATGTSSGATEPPLPVPPVPARPAPTETGNTGAHIPMRVMFDDGLASGGQTPKDRAQSNKETPAETQSFVLSGIIFQGVTVFSLSSLAKDYDNYLAKRISVEDMVAIAEAVTKKYHQAGYFLSRAIVPQQEARTGLLKIEVLEGYVSDVKFENDAPSGLKRYFEPVLREKPAKLSTIDRAITLARDLHGVTLESPQIVPIPDDPRAYRLVIPTKQNPVSASIYIDNRGTKTVGKLQTYVSASANSVLSTGDQVSVGFFTIPDQPKELLFGDVSYTTFLHRSGTNVTLNATRFRAVPGASLAPFDLQFDGKAGGIRLSQPLVRKRDLGLWANLEFEARDLRQTQAQSLAYSDKIRLLRGSINYYQRHAGGESTVSIEVTQGLPVLSASDPSGGALVSRPGADRDFTTADLFVSRYQDLGDVFGLYLAGTGQYSAKPLLTSENFSLGGPKFGRAYDYWEVSGQSGIAGTAELRYGRDPGLKWLTFYQLYAFYDVGAVWNEYSNAATQRESLSSAGGGLRLSLFKKISLNYEVAVPLARVPFERTTRTPRHFFSLSAQF